jgi:hypothetical protein
MKFSREFGTEDAASAHEVALQALGYRAWRTRKADGAWEVFWWVSAAGSVKREIATLGR